MRSSVSSPFLSTPHFSPFRVTFAFVFMGLCLGALWAVSGCEESKPLALGSIEPRTITQGADSKIQILGTGFRKDGLSVRLVGAKSQIQLKQVEYVDAQTLHATVPADAAVGAYDLEVRNGQEKPVVLGGAFEIVSTALRVYFIHVGQGDATLLVSPTGETMLIDTGPPGSAPALLDLLKTLKIEHLDHVLITHFDADHAGSLEALLKGPDGTFSTPDDIKIQKALWDHGGKSKNYSYTRARNRYLKIHKPLDGSSSASFPTIALGEFVKVHVRTTNGVVLKRDQTMHKIACGTDSNCRSVGTLIAAGKFRMWTGGDLTGGGNGTPDVETTLGRELDPVHVYRAHHHGSKTSSNSAFVRALRPRVVVISAGKDNRYCHPHASILSTLLGLNQVWVALTSQGLISSEAVKTCRKSTEERLKSIGDRSLVGLSTFRVEVNSSGYSLVTSKRKEAIRWTY